VVVGHLDTGVDGSHPALEGKIAAYQELDELGMPVASAMHDTGDHGTHTAGTIVGRTHNGTNIGVAPRASLASALVLPGGTGTFAQIVAGMQWTIDQGAHVLNLSLGSVGYSTMWNRPILSAALAGVLVVAAVGNSGAGTSGGPGNDPLALGVGATHHVGGAAGFSGGQALVEVAWLDEAVTYVKPDLCAPGVGVLSSVPADQLAPFNGTSMAAPHVAGVAALVHSAEPGLQLDPFTTRALLLGAGTDDLGEAGRDQRYGFGRLDARSAVAQATSLL
jgi:subtilisin family serine protease